MLLTGTLTSPGVTKRPATKANSATDKTQMINLVFRDIEITRSVEVEAASKADSTQRRDERCALTPRGRLQVFLDENPIRQSGPMHHRQDEIKGTGTYRRRVR